MVSENHGINEMDDGCLGNGGVALQPNVMVRVIFDRLAGSGFRVSPLLLADRP